MSSAEQYIELDLEASGRSHTLTMDTSGQFVPQQVDGEDINNGTNDVEPDTPEEVLEVPTYTMTFTECLSTPEYSMDTGKLIAETSKPKRTCFNCLGDHNVSDCPDPLDQGKISKNRRAHMANKPAFNVRYHELCHNKYGDMAPGVMSNTLRHALGLKDYQLSETVYRMRLLGYPPGWLMEARESTGQVALYGGDGRAVCQPGGEDGEVAGGAKYLPEKLVTYPGFNTSIPLGFKEEAKWYNLPGMQAQHWLEDWRAVMQKNLVTPYRKRKMRTSNTGDIDAKPAPVLDMDEGEDQDLADAEQEPADADLSASTSPQLRKRKSAVENLEEGEVDSDSEVQPIQPKSKRRKSNLPITSSPTGVQDATIDLCSTQGTVTLEDSVRSETDFLIDTEPSSVDPDQDSDSNSRSKNCSDSRSALETDSNPGTPTVSSTPAPGKKLRHHRRAGSKGFVLGAVIPQSISSCSTLPDADKWAVDVTDHILFENLPDALGTWTNMKGLMQKVRSKMNELQAEDD